MKLLSFQPWLPPYGEPQVSSSSVDTESGDNYQHTSLLSNYRRQGDTVEERLIKSPLCFPLNLHIQHAKPDLIIVYGGNSYEKGAVGDRENPYPEILKGAILRPDTNFLKSTDDKVFDVTENHLETVFEKLPTTADFLKLSQDAAAANDFERFCFSVCLSYYFWEKIGKKNEAAKAAKEVEDTRLSAHLAKQHRENEQAQRETQQHRVLELLKIFED